LRVNYNPSALPLAKGLVQKNEGKVVRGLFRPCRFVHKVLRREALSRLASCLVHYGHMKCDAATVDA